MRDMRGRGEIKQKRDKIKNWREKRKKQGREKEKS